MCDGVDGEDLPGMRGAREFVAWYNGGVRAVRPAAPDGTIDEVSTGLVLRSIGYRGRPLGGLPFDQARGTVANDGGRVIDPDSDTTVVGRHVTGWIKRGPSGVIGTNR
ncbi:hypothetical protein L5I01_01635 [Gordonia sp. HY442]|uniref:hypothetical protein n=1 Tax=Gordonia zhenghanii TaxID=2911516 RepID=UPI001F36EC2D|nr:hypothetical protein [Gordonia zhenghanii]MCF8601985.1 hypothetical protein [Gordonia zhenghanii]MCF8602053.1 hypothetical protein [Gordonia zhenghanii]